MTVFSDLQRASQYLLREVRGEPAETVRSYFRGFGMDVSGGAPVGHTGSLCAYAVLTDRGIAWCDDSVTEYPLKGGYGADGTRTG